MTQIRNLALALGMVAAILIADVLQTRARGEEQKAEWRMTGHDVNDTRGQPS